MKKPTVLFLVPEDSRTGSTLILVKFLRWLRNAEVSKNVNWAVVVGRCLNRDKQAVVNREEFGLRFDFPRETDLPAFLRRIPGFFRCYRALSIVIMRFRLKRLNIKLIIGISIMNGEVLSVLDALKGPVWIYSMEGCSFLDRMKESYAAVIKRRTVRFAAISNSSRTLLEKRLMCPPGSVELLYPPSDENLNPAAVSREAVLRSLGFSEDVFLVAACGSIGWRKGTDLFIQTARRTLELAGGRSLGFLWVGGHYEGKVPYELLYDVKLAGLEKQIRFTGHVVNSREFIALADVFWLTSREEPFGLVCIEAGLEGKPVICFEGAGGAEEFVESDAGFCVPYLNTDAMAEKTVLLLGDEELRRRLGQRAREKVLERHAPDTIGKKVLKCILETIEPSEKK